MPVAPTQCHVLVVEHDPGMADMLVQAVRARGMSVECTGSANEALERIRERRPSIVVCETTLPDGEGTDILHEVRANPNLATVQFVLLASEGDALSRRAGMDLGANDYLGKPFTLEEFDSCVAARCRQAALLRRLEQHNIERMQSTLTSVLPHEFFTPLAGIIGLSELLREDLEVLQPRQCREYLEEIEESALRLRRSLENYLQILRLQKDARQAGAEVREAPVCDLLPAFAGAAAEVARRHQRTDDLLMECSVDGEHRLLQIDGVRLGKITAELMDNALKFSKCGTPVVVRLEATNGLLRLTVEDRGRGMTAEEIAQVGAFRQFNRDRFEQQGLGLGLTLAHYLVDASGGRCQIRNREGGGTILEVSWPLRSPDYPGGD